MSFERAGILRELVCKAAYFDIRRQRAEIRQFRRELPIDEHQSASSAGNVKLLKVRRCNALMRSRSKQKRLAGNRIYIGEAPIFISGRRETYFAEAGEGVFA